ADWRATLASCGRVADVDADYPGLKPALAKAYLDRGLEQVADGRALDAAVATFEQALALDPSNAGARQQREWAVADRAGDAAVEAGDWATASERFAALAREAPSYRADVPDGSLGAKRFAAALGWGGALLTAGDYVGAKERCEEALALVPDDPEAA